MEWFVKKAKAINKAFLQVEKVGFYAVFSNYAIEIRCTLGNGFASVLTFTSLYWYTI
jgi:hypothetical protein